MACCPRVADLITILLAVGIVTCSDRAQTPTLLLGRPISIFPSTTLCLSPAYWLLGFHKHYVRCRRISKSRYFCEPSLLLFSLFIQSDTLAHVTVLSAFRVNLLSSVKPFEVHSQTQPKCASLISYVFLNQMKLMIKINRHALSLAVCKGVDFSTSMQTLVIACHFDYSCTDAWKWYLFVIPT